MLFVQPSELLKWVHKKLKASACLADWCKRNDNAPLFILLKNSPELKWYICKVTLTGSITACRLLLDAYFEIYYTHRTDREAASTVNRLICHLH